MLATDITSSSLERARKANRHATRALCFSIVALLINVLAYLDEIVCFVHYVQSCLR